MHKEKSAKVAKGIILRIFPNRVEITTPATGVLGKSLSLEILKTREIPKEGLEVEVLSIKPVQTKKAKSVSKKRKKPAAKPKKETKKNEKKEKPALEKNNKSKPKKAEKKSLTVKDAKLVGIGQTPGSKKPVEVYETDKDFYLHQKGKGPKLTRLMNKKKYAAILEKFKEQTLPEEYSMAKIFLTDVFRPKLTEKSFNRFVLIATAQKDFAVEGEGENAMIKQASPVNGPSPH